MSVSINENALKFCEALESGNYPQVDGCLANMLGFSAMGVACEVAMQNGIAIQKTFNADGTYWYSEEDGSVLAPIAVWEWLGFRDCVGTMADGATIQLLNQQGKTFSQIAAVIRSNPPGLFK